ncbi:hypothetical protein ARNL5_03630 [Anaerolineae bacterium]|nr:hypothetical protein ARNL5_03630 [Anaerolineae bacterium]
MNTFTDLVLLIGTNPLPNYVVARKGNIWSYINMATCLCEHIRLAQFG